MDRFKNNLFQSRRAMRNGRQDWRRLHSCNVAQQQRHIVASLWPAERVLACQQMVVDNAVSKNVTEIIGVLTFELLRRHEGKGSHQTTVLRHSGTAIPHQTRNSEVHELHGT